MASLTYHQRLPLDPGVTSIYPAAVLRLNIDVTLLSQFVSSLSLPPTTDNADTDDNNPSILRRTVDELVQTVALMASSNPDEFFDISQRNKKFGSVNAQIGPELLAKADRGKEEARERIAAAEESESRNVGGGKGYGERAEEARAKASERFNNVMKGFRSQRFGEGGSGGGAA